MSKKHLHKRSEAKRKRRRCRQQKGYTHLGVERAKVEPKPAARARSYFVSQIWQRLSLDAALEWVRITKEGLPMATILIATLMMGLLGVNSLQQS